MTDSRLLTDTDVQQRVDDLRGELAEAAGRSGRAEADIRIVAAVKYLDPDAITQLVRAGITDLAENRLERLESTRRVVSDAGLDVTWHFIGRLQSRKVSDIAGLASCIHTLASESAARRLAAHLEAGEAVPLILVQVNTAGDPSKDGLTPVEVEPFLDAVPDCISVGGFMTMPAATGSPDDSRRAFAELRQLRDRTAERFPERHDLRYLSMGTSQDWKVAVEEGATHVRLGRVLYAGG